MIEEESCREYMLLSPEKKTATEIITMYAIGLDKPKSSTARKKAEIGHLVAEAKRPMEQLADERMGSRPMIGARKAPKAPPEKSKGLISPPLKEKAATMPINTSLIKRHRQGP